METKTETVEQKLLRTLQELAAPHAISPEGRQAILPLVPLAQVIEAAAREREDRIHTLEELLDHAGKDDGALRQQLQAAHARAEEATAALTGERAITAQLETKVIEARTERDALAAKLEQIPVISPNIPALELEQAKDVYAEGLSLGILVGECQALGKTIPDGAATIEQLQRAKATLDAELAGSAAAQGADEIPFGKEPPETGKKKRGK